MGKPISHTLKKKVHAFVCGRCINDDHGLCGFVRDTGGCLNKAGQSQCQTATSSGRIPQGARATPRKIGKLKAAHPSGESRGF